MEVGQIVVGIAQGRPAGWEPDGNVQLEPHRLFIAVRVAVLACLEAHRPDQFVGGIEQQPRLSRRPPEHLLEKAGRLYQPVARVRQQGPDDQSAGQVQEDDHPGFAGQRSIRQGLAAFRQEVVSRIQITQLDRVPHLPARVPHVCLPGARTGRLARRCRSRQKLPRSRLVEVVLR
jgi:hypothetical protein